VSEQPPPKSLTQRTHHRQAVRRQAQEHHWRFYRARVDWNFIQNFARAPIRWKREHVVLASLGSLMAVLGFVFAPSWSSSVRADMPASAQVMTRPVELPAVSAPIAQPEAQAPQWVDVEVKRGQTMGDIFSSLGLSGKQLHRMLQNPDQAKHLVRIRPGDRFAFLIPEPGQLSAIRFDAGERQRMELRVDGESVRSTVTERAIERQVQVAEGRITRSLFGAGERAGLSDATIMQMANVFGYDIDFAQDLRAGDEFSVIYETLYRDGERLRDGDIIAASFINNGKRFTALRYTHDDGRVEYFGPDGRSLRKAFLRTPVEFSRISSRFSTARKHPILGLTRAHRGVDYAAPKGTPIRAAGDGKVVFRGWKSGYGNAVVLQHGGQYSTLYGHMSRFAEGTGVGSRVDQGEVIGYVGMTGLATAPHLHYEFQVNGVHRDPLTVELPKADPLPASELADFRRATQPLVARLELIEQRARAVASR
jgi:murein DD-endopeptidase MepM/ murein hydrolase activator NlpD